MVKWSMRNCVSDNCPILHHLDFYDPGEFPTPSRTGGLCKSRNNLLGRESAAPELCAAPNRRISH
jgi:hypothetical protein